MASCWMVAHRGRWPRPHRNSRRNFHDSPAMSADGPVRTARQLRVLLVLPSSAVLQHTLLHAVQYLLQSLLWTVIAAAVRPMLFGLPTDPHAECVLPALDAVTVSRETAAARFPCAAARAGS